MYSHFSLARKPHPKLVSLKTEPIFQDHVCSGQNVEGQQGDHCDGWDPHPGSLCLEGASEQHGICTCRLVCVDTEDCHICSITSGSEKDYPWIEIAKHVKAAQNAQQEGGSGPAAPPQEK